MSIAKSDSPVPMDAFSPSNPHDEGYSEDPLNPPPRNAALTSLATMRSPADIPAWLAANASALPVSIRTGTCDSGLLLFRFLLT